MSDKWRIPDDVRFYLGRIHDIAWRQSFNSRDPLQGTERLAALGNNGRVSLIPDLSNLEFNILRRYAKNS